jgi:hypothetical protein
VNDDCVSYNNDNDLRALHVRRHLAKDSKNTRTICADRIRSHRANAVYRGTTDRPTHGKACYQDVHILVACFAVGRSVGCTAVNSVRPVGSYPICTYRSRVFRVFRQVASRMQAPVRQPCGFGSPAAWRRCFSHLFFNASPKPDFDPPNRVPRVGPDLKRLSACRHDTRFVGSHLPVTHISTSSFLQFIPH